MSKTNFQKCIGEFLGASSKKTLRMTTFSLNEYVTFHFFNQVFEEWPEKIVICCDRMKHTHHGYLRENKPKGCTILIKDFTVTKGTKDKNIPVFHSKIWEVRDKDKDKSDYLISSINLSSSHLLIGNKSFENLVTFSVVGRNNVRSRIDKIFNARSGKIDPDFIAIDLRESEPKLIDQDDLKKEISESKFISATAPFYSKTMLSNLNIISKDAEKSNFYTCQYSHAKIISTDSFSVTGSANLTCAAWGNKNHETVVMTKGSTGIPKDFESVSFSKCKNKDLEISWDNEKDTDKWEEEYEKSLLGISAKIENIEISGKKWIVSLSINPSTKIKEVSFNKIKATKEKNRFSFNLSCESLRKMIHTHGDILSIKIKDKKYSIPIDKGSWTRQAYSDNKNTKSTPGESSKPQSNSKNESKSRVPHLDVREIRDNCKGKEIVDIILSTEYDLNDIPAWSYIND